MCCDIDMRCGPPEMQSAKSAAGHVLFHPCEVSFALGVDQSLAQKDVYEATRVFPVSSIARAMLSPRVSCLKGWLRQLPQKPDKSLISVGE